MTARSLIAVLSLLLLGAAVGVSGDRFMQAHHGGPHMVDGHFVGDPVTLMDDELKLTPAQRDTIRAIFSRSQPQVDAAWHAARAQVYATIEHVISQVAAQLDSVQRVRFYELVEQVHGEHAMRLLHRSR
jgi:Spy/CpxP family protein refolding chaperone